MSAWVNWNSSEHHQEGFGRKPCRTSSPYEYRREPPAGIVWTVRTPSCVVCVGFGGGDASGCGLMRTAGSVTSTGTFAALFTRIPTGDVTVWPSRSYVSFTTVAVTSPRPAASQKVIAPESARDAGAPMCTELTAVTAATRTMNTVSLNEKALIPSRSAAESKI